MALPKPALLRAVSDEIPLDVVAQLTSTYIQPSEIAAVARIAITGDETGDSDSTSFAGHSRYIFVGAGTGAFIDPGGTLLQNARQRALGLRRARGADPAGMKKRQARVVKPAAQPSGTM